ncbi:MAG: two-component system nitrogen regulation sensor histidine kinase NtrY [Ancylomarina sp.]|jgi:two-component system nitrogen regulation sensor histidine kinase NtrY
MGYKYYNSILFLRVISLIALAIVIGYTFSNQVYYASGICMILEIYWAWSFILFLNKTHKQMNYFVQAIKNKDTTLHFPKKSGNKIIDELSSSLNELNGIIQNVQMKSKIKETYFAEILQNIATGVIVITEGGFVTDVNSATLELLGLETFTHIKQLNRIDSKFSLNLSNLKNKQRKVLNLTTKNEHIQVMTRCSIIRIEKEEVKLITLQDIRGELERKEIDAWVKLIRVLSHEIMNSLAPVTSISESLKQIWEEKQQTHADNKQDSDVSKTLDGLNVITQTNQDLIQFVQSYRVLSKAPIPKLNSINANSFFDRLNILLSPIKESFSGRLKLFTPDKNFTFIADEQMLIQVIINLVKNASEACLEETNKMNLESVIKISAKQNGATTEIKVSDNGPGIPNEIQDEIFVPFFTTKESGSGIGLSYSRQIIRAHGGSLLYQAKKEETAFIVRW